MDIDKQKISRSRGVTAFGTDGYQQIYSQYNSSIAFVSDIIPYEDSISIPLKQAVDSCWTSGNIFRLGSNKVIKTNYSGDILYSLSLTAPNSLSVIQFAVPMEDENPGENECLGCWIISGTSVYKTNSNLEIEKEILGLSNPSLVCVNHESSGCYVVDEGVGIYEFDSNADLVGSSTFTDDHILQTTCSASGDLFLLTETKLFKFVNNNGNIVTGVTYNLAAFLGVLPAGSFDIDTFADRVYVSAGDNTTLRVLKFNLSGVLQGSITTSGLFPHVTKVSQHPSSSTLYLLTDEDKIDPVESSSSSSSSSSDSSSSSSSIDSSSSSSSS